MKELDFRIGAQVHCQDGKCGKLARVSVDPETWQVRDLIVEEGFLLKRARVFPVSLVTKATNENIYLSIHSDELADYREFKETEFEVAADWENYVRPRAELPTTSVLVPSTQHGLAAVGEVPVVREKVREGIASELEVVERGTPIKNPDGVIGKLDHVVMDTDSNRITHLVTRQGIIFTENLVIPLSIVERVSEEGIFVKATKETLETLPRYVPEEELMDEEEGEEVRSGDFALADGVANALAAHPQTDGAVIEVINNQGVITLAGTVDSQQAREAAEAVAREQPGVVLVVNELKVERQ